MIDGIYKSIEDGVSKLLCVKGSRAYFLHSKYGLDPRDDDRNKGYINHLTQGGGWILNSKNFTDFKFVCPIEKVKYHYPEKSIKEMYP